MPIKDFMRTLSWAIEKKELNCSLFANRIVHNGGVDMESVSPNMILDLFEEKYPKCKDDLLWSFSETINMYEYSTSGDDLCCGIFSLIVLCKLCSQDKDEYYAHFDKMIRMFYFFYSQIDTSLAVVLFNLCFSEQPQFPEVLNIDYWSQKNKQT